MLDLDARVRLVFKKVVGFLYFFIFKRLVMVFDLARNHVKSALKAHILDSIVLNSQLVVQILHLRGLVWGRNHHAVNRNGVACNLHDSVRLNANLAHDPPLHL